MKWGYLSCFGQYIPRVACCHLMKNEGSDLLFLAELKNNSQRSGNNNMKRDKRKKRDADAIPHNEISLSAPIDSLSSIRSCRRAASESGWGLFGIRQRCMLYQLCYPWKKKKVTDRKKKKAFVKHFNECVCLFFKVVWHDRNTIHPLKLKPRFPFVFS